MTTIRNVVRWLAWQIGEHDAASVAACEPPARITVFSAIDGD
jgi:hypothetical protein